MRDHTLLLQILRQLKGNTVQKFIKVALVSIALSAGAPSIAFASHGDAFIAAVIGGAAGAYIGSSMGHRYDEYPVRQVYITREQPVERVVYVQPSYRQSVYYYADEPRYYDQGHHYNHRNHHGRFRDGDDD